MLFGVVWCLFFVAGCWMLVVVLVLVVVGGGGVGVVAVVIIIVVAGSYLLFKNLSSLLKEDIPAWRFPTLQPFPTFAAFADRCS